MTDTTEVQDPADWQDAAPSFDADPGWVTEHRRRECLNLALRAYGTRFAVPAEILKAAEAFEAYLKGDTQ
jgi:hypothetical protein